MNRLTIIIIIAIMFPMRLYADDRLISKNAQDHNSILSQNDLQAPKVDSIQEKEKPEIGGAYGALMVRKELINPILESISENHVSCTEVQDNLTAFEELKAIDRKSESPRKFLEFWNSEIDEYSITPSLERRIQEGTEGHITYYYPNRSTINALAEFWRKYPCTEAGAVALLKIKGLLIHPEYLNMIMDSNGDYILSFKSEIMAMNLLIEKMYKNSWEGECSRISYASLVYKVDSIEYIHANERWIQYVETNGSYNNKYFKYMSSVDDTRKEFFSSAYSVLSRAYLDRGEKIAFEGLEKNGKIPPEAIEMYKKHKAMRKHKKEVYPEYYKEMTDRLPPLYKLIRDKAPEYYETEPCEKEGKCK